MAPIRSFGAYGAIGTLLTLGVVLAFLPGTLAAWRPKTMGASPQQNSDDVEHARHPVWDRLSGAVLRWHGAIVIGSVVIMAVAGWGIQWLTTSVHIETLFGHHSRILQDYAWIEEHVGPLVPVEVILDFRRDCPLSPIDRFQMVDRVEDELRNVEHVQGTMSCAKLLPAIPADIDQSAPNTATFSRTSSPRRALLHRSPLFARRSRE